jgi:diguanylate cyclase (GGDEF)-like protein
MNYRASEDINYLQVSESKSEKATHLSEDAVGQELLRILEQPDEFLRPVYQPIVSLRSRTVFAHEALIRGPAGSVLEFPDQLFTVAQDYDLEELLDQSARIRVVEEYVNQQSTKNLFINVGAEILGKKENLKRILQHFEQIEVPTDHIVIEITEQSPIQNPGEFVRSIERYREHGFQVALDDLGTGYNGLKLWSELRPEFVKIDKHFILDIGKDAEKHRFLETILSLANSLNSQVIAEGVEKEDDLEVLEQFNIPFVQGYLFLRPQAQITDQLDYQWITPDTAKITDEEKVAHLTRQVASITPDTSVHQAADLFHKSETTEFLPVVHHSKVLGMVWRHDLMDKLASRFGRDLYHRQPILRLMDRNPIVVDKNLPVENLSRTITEYQFQHKGDAFIVTDNNRFIGCGRFLDLLRYITDLKIKSAHYANPLSGLPGNVPIQKSMQEWLDKQLSFALLYIDLDHFKPYNDHYSYEQGDGIIRALSSLLQRYVPSTDDFLGHIGGDDFILMIKDVEQATDLARVIIDEFHEMIFSFYNQEDIARGGITGIDREGREKLFSLMTMSIGVVEVTPGHIEHQQRLSSIATRAKKKAKNEGGNCYSVINTSDL